MSSGFITTRFVFAGVAGLLSLSSLAVSTSATAQERAARAAKATSKQQTVTVYKSPNCGCCGRWENYLRKSGFKVVSKPTQDMNAIRAKHAVPSELSSCHTAVVGDYVVEGHVPLEAINKMLSERPQIAGLMLPGMPMGSPGMEGPYSESYDVMSLSKSGEKKVYYSVKK